MQKIILAVLNFAKVHHKLFILACLHTQRHEPFWVCNGISNLVCIGTINPTSKKTIANSI